MGEWTLSWLLESDFKIILPSMYTMGGGFYPPLNDAT